MAESLRDKFNISSRDFLTDEEMDKLDRKLAGLADMVKSGYYVVKATENNEQTERRSNIDIIMTVIIEPSQAYAPTAPIKSMQFEFTTDGYDGSTSVLFGIATADKSFANHVFKQDHLSGFLKQVASLGTEKIKQDFLAAQQKKHSGFDDIKL
jgi:hypothetical protein